MNAHSAVRDACSASARREASMGDDEFEGSDTATETESTMNWVSSGVATLHSRWLTTAPSAMSKKDHSEHE